MRFQAVLIALYLAVPLMFLTHSIASWSQKSETDWLPSGNADLTASWTTVTNKKHFVVRVDPATNMSTYNRIAVGNVTYTGPEKKLSAKESERMTSLLRDRLTRDLSTAKLNTTSSALESLTLNAEITSVKRVHPWVNVLTMAAVNVPLDLGDATVTAWVVDQQTGRAVVEIDTVGCGQVYEVFASLKPLGQSRLALKKNSRRIAKEIGQLSFIQQATTVKASEVALVR